MLWYYSFPFLFVLRFFIVAIHLPAWILFRKPKTGPPDKPHRHRDLHSSCIEIRNLFIPLNIFLWLTAIDCGDINIFAAHFSSCNQPKFSPVPAHKNWPNRSAKDMVQSLGKINIQRFSDGEICPIFLESIRGDFVFLVQSTYSPADNLMELLLMIDAARRASAYKVIAVMPYYGYARQDQKGQTPCSNWQ